MKRSLLFFISLFLACGYLFCNDGKFVVVIDAGHGGKDPGAIRGKYKEKDINLGVAIELGRLIEKNMADVKVVFTRKTDVFVDLDKRAQIANKAKANLFISIHTNSTDAKSTKASGADTYILGLARSAENLAVAKRENSVILLEDDYSTKYEGFDPNSPESNIIFEFMTNTYMEQSLQFASHVQKDFKDIARRVDRGVRQAGFLVLRRTGMPSVLIELGFINNDTEAKYLSSALGQRAMATSIYSGFRKYKLDFDRKQGGKNVAQPIAQNVIKEELEDIAVVEEQTKNEEMAVAEVTGPVIKSVAKPAVQQNAVKQEEKKTVKETAKSEPMKLNPPPPARAQQIQSSKSMKSGVTEYRVQFLMSDKKLPDNSSEFKGLSPVSFYKDGGAYKYTYGSTTNWAEIQRIQKQVRTKFSDAFVIRFKDGERVK